MTIRIRRALGMIALLAALSASRLLAQDLWVYDNALVGGFQDWSWATRNLAATGDVHSAPAAISWEPDNWQGLYFHSSAAFDCADYLSLRLWVKGVGGGGQQIDLAIQLEGGALATVDLDTYLPAGGISSSQWREAVLPFATLGLTSCSFNELVLQAATAANQPEVRVDDIRFLFDPTPPAAVAVTVDPALDRRPISDLVYGVNFASPAQLAAIGYPLNRWGGNRTTRYNWQLDVDNSAADWFFTNYTGEDDPPNLPAGSSADLFLRDSRAARAEVVLTLPTIGRVAGARALGDRIRAVSNDAAHVGAFAIRGHADELLLLLFNKDNAAREVVVSIAGSLAGNFALHRFTATTNLGPAGSANLAGGVLSLTLPPRSATLARGRLATNLIFQDRFETGTYLGWSAAAP
jgi:hypothetical protein